MDRKTWGCAAFAASIAAAGWHDAAAGAWLGVWTIALAPLAIRLASRASRPRAAVAALEAEALAWTASGSGSGGPSGGRPVGTARARHASARHRIEAAAGTA